VKATGNGRRYSEPQERVDARKQRLITEAALTYLESHLSPDLLPRFDVITVDLSSAQPRLHHLQDAFRPHAETLDIKILSA